MTTCIRRAHSVWPTCNCPPCRADRLRKTKLARSGHYHRIPSERAWEVLDHLAAQGWSSQAVASSAGLAWRTVEAAYGDDKRGHRRTLGPGTSRNIVNHGDPIRGTVGTDGSRRRLQGLARQGYDLTTLATMTGIGFSTLAAIRIGDTTRIRAGFYVTIRDTAERIGLQVGPSVQAIENAIRKDWVPLLAWDDIDDPKEQPQGVHLPRDGRRLSHAEARAVDLEMFVAADMSLEEAARQLGISRDSLWAWCDRHDARHLYERLSRPHRTTENQHTTKGAA